MILHWRSTSKSQAAANPESVQRSSSFRWFLDILLSARLSRSTLRTLRLTTFKIDFKAFILECLFLLFSELVDVKGNLRTGEPIAVSAFDLKILEIRVDL